MCPRVGKGCKIEEKKSWTLLHCHANKATMTPKDVLDKMIYHQENHQEMENKKGEKIWGRKRWQEKHQK